MLEEDVYEQMFKVFMPEAFRNTERIRQTGKRFVHYTSAESGIKILQSGRMLLRNSAMMNDFSEVQHGLDCLLNAYNGDIGERLKAVMRAVQPDLPDIFESDFNERIFDIRSETYLVSISEHGDPDHGDDLEDLFGRLSMWRAYASRNGIAFIFKNAPFLTESNALNAFTSPVLYALPKDFKAKFDEIVTGAEAIKDQLVELGGQFLYETLMNTFRFAVQSTKHPSFGEEREWRVIYSPTILCREGKLTDVQMEKIPTDQMILSGVPQRVYAIPFKNYPDEGFVGATLPELIDRVLIGPSADAYQIRQAFVAELLRCGVEDAESKVFATGIPLRQY